MPKEEAGDNMSDVYRPGGTTVTVFNTHFSIEVMITDADGNSVTLMDEASRFVAYTLAIEVLKKPVDA